MHNTLHFYQLPTTLFHFLFRAYYQTSALHPQFHFLFNLSISQFAVRSDPRRRRLQVTRLHRGTLSSPSCRYCRSCALVRSLLIIATYHKVWRLPGFFCCLCNFFGCPYACPAPYLVPLQLYIHLDLQFYIQHQTSLLKISLRPCAELLPVARGLQEAQPQTEHNLLS